MVNLTKEDLKEGSTYRAKRYKEMEFGWNNNRTILWIGEGKVQYDSDIVKDGQNYPMVDIDRFLRWAKEEVLESNTDAS